MRQWVGFAVVCLAVLLSGCVLQQQSRQPQRLATPSGNPEVIVLGTTRKTATDRIVASKLEKGMQIRSVSDYGVVVGGKMSQYPMASMLFGSSYDSNPELRYTYNLVDVPGGIRIFARCEIVTNPGSAFERPTDITRDLGADLQAELERLRSAIGR